MGVFKKLLKIKPKIIEQAPEKKDDCWYNNAHEQGENRDALPMDAAGSVNQFEYGQTKNSSIH